MKALIISGIISCLIIGFIFIRWIFNSLEEAESSPHCSTGDIAEMLWLGRGVEEITEIATRLSLSESEVENMMDSEMSNFRKCCDLLAEGNISNKQFSDRLLKIAQQWKNQQQLNRSLEIIPCT